MSSAEYLLVAYNTREHIAQKRRAELSSLEHALEGVLTRVKYCTGKRRHNAQERTIVATYTPEKWLVVGLKFVGKDEAWVQTAYFIYDKELRREIAKGTLRPVIGSNWPQERI